MTQRGLVWGYFSGPRRNRPGATLMPCRWVDGWPMLGDENGHVPLTMEKEIYPTENTKGILGSDDFSDEKLSLYWQWNHNPVDDKVVFDGTSGLSAIEDQPGG